MQFSCCQQCGTSIPLGESFSVFGRTLCRPCADAALANVAEVPAGSVARNVDPTVCAHCSVDGGDKAFPLLASLPLCDSCTAFFRNRPFPGWVKLFAAAVLAAVVTGWVCHWRFVLAHVELNQGGRAWTAGDIDTAASLVASASNRVPEDDDLRCFSDYCSATVLLRDDKCREALPKLMHCAGKLPPEWGVVEMTRYARLGAAFNEADYDEFLRIAQEMAAARPEDPIAVGWLASAYACKYAATGDEAFRQKSLESLASAEKLGPTDEFAEYEMRIRYRLATREIISGAEFQKRFPNGWKAPEASP
jgi:hypothetical protein